MYYASQSYLSEKDYKLLFNALYDIVNQNDYNNWSGIDADYYKACYDKLCKKVSHESNHTAWGKKLAGRLSNNFDLIDTQLYKAINSIGYDILVHKS